MRKAWLIAVREITWEVLGDRGSVLRMLMFAALPLAFVLLNRNTGGRGSDVIIFVLALQSALLPALTGVGLIASTFSQEKESQTLVPLLAAPIRDVDIVVGKLLGMLLPVGMLSVATLALFYGFATVVYGAARVQRALPPELVYSIVILTVLYVLTTGSWVLIVAARVRTSRGAQQTAGLVIAGSVFLFGALGTIAANLFEGWPLIALGPLIVLADVAALEVARRAWQRGEVIGRI
jgi:ABC-type Na+ efflux pump permease subunit